ncbi:MAG: hypothetical protein JRI44_03520 [Deltaproteobacteria bacterium]|nr:hypothetical protein [Deltaproteobacteria bacterium]
MKFNHHNIKQFLLVFLSLYAFLFFFFLTDNAYTQQLRIEQYNGGFFSIKKPVGWNLITAGQCSEFAFLMMDPYHPLRKVFFFGSVGPVYLNQQQKMIDMQYMRMGGYNIPWFEMPVIAPLTPENFLKRFHLITKTQIARNFMPQAPSLDNLTIINSTPAQSLITGGTTSLIRAIFAEHGRVGEGLFMVTVAPLLPFTGNPGSGIGYGMLISGITAPKKEFKYLVNTLVGILNSFTISQRYTQMCMAQQAQTYKAILRAGRTLSETSDMIMEGWQRRNKVYDIIAEKRSDAILGKERLYDPNTNQVYEFRNGFYDQYRLNRNRYEMNNLQPLPDNNYELWMKAPLDGERLLR